MSGIHTGSSQSSLKLVPPSRRIANDQLSIQNRYLIDNWTMPTPTPTAAAATARLIADVVDTGLLARDVDDAVAAIAHQMHLAVTDAVERLVQRTTLHAATAQWLDIPSDWRADPYLVRLVELAVADRAGLGIEPWLTAARSGTEPHINYRLWGHTGRAKVPAPQRPRRARWADIGAVLGITAQAAQQRRRTKHGPLAVKDRLKTALWAAVADRRNMADAYSARLHS